MLPNQKATLRIIFTNEFGNRTEVIKELMNSSCGEVVEAFRQSMLGFGFHPDSVNDYIEGE